MLDWRWFRRLALRLRTLFQRDRVDRELEEEFQFHIEQRTELEIARGLSPEEARCAALRAMDGAEQRKEECRDMRHVNFIDDLWRDLRYAGRSLRRNPGFASLAVLIMALGIGPNTAIFSIVYATLLAPLPFPDPEQLVIVWSKVRGGRDGTSPAEYVDWKQQATSFQYLEPFWPRQFNLATPEAPERVRARQTSPDGYRMLGEGVWLGRDFRADEDQPGKNQVVLLSHRLWKRYGSDPSIIGREIRLDSKPYTVIGVLPRDHRIGGRPICGFLSR